LEPDGLSKMASAFATVVTRTLIPTLFNFMLGSDPGWDLNTTSCNGKPTK
jgi:hypothetical protein